jgi:hypothetical protein
MYVQAMPGGPAQRVSNPDLLEAEVKVTTPTVHVTTPKINTTTPSTVHGVTTKNGTQKSLDHRATVHKPMVNGIGPADPVAKSDGIK